MDDFKLKYVGFAALLAVVADLAKDSVNAVGGSGSLLSRLIGFENIVPDVVALLPQVGNLGAEIKAMSPADLEMAAEVLVSDLAFSSDKAKVVIAAAFPLAEQLVALIAPVEALVLAIKS